MSTIDESSAPPALCEPSDLELVGRTRSGDRSAFAELWRRHARAGRTVARSYALDPDDVVAEAFTKILQAITSGGGPTTAFRPYLFSTIRNVAMQWRRGAVTDPSDELDALADPHTDEAETLLALDKSLTAHAFRSLPTRWQEVLWYSEVEQLSMQEIGPLLGMNPNAVSALAFRAREGLRQAWIQAHLIRSADSECAAVIDKLGSYTRGNLGPRESARVRIHLENCASCSIVDTEAREVGSRLALVLLPLVAGIAGATAYTVWLQDAAPASAATLVPGGTGTTSGSSAARPDVMPTSIMRGGSTNALSAVSASSPVAVLAGGASVLVALAAAVAGVILVGGLISPPMNSPVAGADPITTQPTPHATGADPDSAVGPVSTEPSAAHASEALGGRLNAQGRAGAAGIRAGATVPGARLRGGESGSAAAQATTTPSPGGRDENSPTGQPGSATTPTADPTPTAPTGPTPTPPPLPPTDPQTPTAPPTPVGQFSVDPRHLFYPELIGTTEPGSTVEVIDLDAGGTSSDDGLTSDPNIVARAVGDPVTGQFSVDDYPDLGFGTHTLVFREVNTGGIPSPASNPTSVTLEPIDLTSPTDGTEVRDGSFTVVARGVAGTRIELFVNGEPQPDTLTMGPDGFLGARLDLPPGTPDGDTTIGLRYTDASTGRFGPTVTATVLVSEPVPVPVPGPLPLPL